MQVAQFNRDETETMMDLAAKGRLHLLSDWCSLSVAKCSLSGYLPCGGENAYCYANVTIETRPSISPESLIHLLSVTEPAHRSFAPAAFLQSQLEGM
jgi:hypothetical protein